MRYELWARRMGHTEWRKVYTTNVYEFARSRAKWQWQGYATAIYDNERQTLTLGR